MVFDIAGEHLDVDAVTIHVSQALDGIRAANPKGLVIRSAKEAGFIAGADVEEFTRFANAEEAMSFVKLGWDVFAKLRALPFTPERVWRAIQEKGGGS